MPQGLVHGWITQDVPKRHVNRGRRVAGKFKTAARQPVDLVRGRLPCLLPANGSGCQVRGQRLEACTLGQARRLHW